MGLGVLDQKIRSDLGKVIVTLLEKTVCKVMCEGRSSIIDDISQICVCWARLCRAQKL